MTDTPPFRAGDKVVVVDDSPGWVTGKCELTKGDIHCVEDCWLTPNRHWAVAILGIDLGLHPDGYPLGFNHMRFRRIWTQETTTVTSVEATRDQEVPSHG